MKRSKRHKKDRRNGLWDEAAILLGGIGIGCYMPYAEYIVWFSALSGLIWIYFKGQRYLEYRSEWYD